MLIGTSLVFIINTQGFLVLL